jgi:hypothetical protein
MACPASAMGLVSNDGSTSQIVSATISTTNVADDTVTYRVAPASGQPAGWFSKIGYNVAPSTLTVVSITDNSKNLGWKYKGYQPMFNGMRFYEYDDGQDHEVTEVVVVFSGTINGAPTFAAHVQWDSGSAFFGPSDTTQIPEFSTIAIPIAAILGLMFIFGRRKQE